MGSIRMDSKSRVLVVEDHKISQKVASLVFGTLNCHLEIASTASEAISLVNSNPYDIIFMDLGLPDMSGLNATTQIRQLANDQGKNIPIIALTAHTTASFAENAFKVGMNSFVEKPLLIPKILKVLMHYLPQFYPTPVKADSYLVENAA